MRHTRASAGSRNGAPGTNRLPRVAPEVGETLRHRGHLYEVLDVKPADPSHFVVSVGAPLAPAEARLSAA